MTQYLIDPDTRAVVAELIPDQEIIIHDENMLDRLTKNGIVVSVIFSRTYNLKDHKVYPTDDKKIFAKAFVEFKFVHGLGQKGYKWSDYDNRWADSASIEELTKYVLSDYRKKQEASSSLPSE